MAIQVPEVRRPKAVHDYVLQPAFAVVRFVLSFTVVRLSSAAFVLLPAYLLLKALSVLPSIVGNATLLLTASGRTELICQADSRRRKEEHQARSQLNGTFRFQQTQLVSARKHAIRLEARWYPSIEDFEVCGARVNVVHETPTAGRKGMQVVLLHGNPSWSFMWRDVIPILIEAGHEVFALDWIGHGLSDKPVDPSTISVELHMQTLIALFEHFDIEDCCIVAHDWGGVIASCTAPYLPTTVSPRIVLLNAFLPPRPSDIALHYYSLYLLWFFSTGIFNGYLPEWGIMRYMSPTVTAPVTRGYEAPYKYGGVKTKSSITRFSHIVPGFSDFFLSTIRSSSSWRLFEGLCDPSRFTNFNAQSRLVERDTYVRSFWRTCSRQNWRAMVVFGAEDPLLKDFKKVLERVIDEHALVKAPAGGWIAKAGHYPTEERPKSVAEIVCWFLETTDRRPRTK